MVNGPNFINLEYKHYIYRPFQTVDIERKFLKVD